MILVDTSVWIEVFRRSKPLDLAALASPDDIVTCLPVIQEVLQGFRDERAYRLARDAMLAFPTVESPIEVDLILEAVGLYRATRQRGLTVRSSVDCLIAAAAVRHDVEVLHRDRDFAAIALVSPLRQRSIVQRSPSPTR